MKLQLHKLERNKFSITQQLNSLKVFSDNNAIKEALETIIETKKNLKELLNSERDDTSIMCSCDDSISTRKYLKILSTRSCLISRKMVLLHHFLRNGQPAVDHIYKYFLIFKLS